MRYLVIVALLAVGCGPQAGDIYESTLTHERIQIVTVGDCQSIHAAYEAENEAATSLIDSTFTFQQGIKLSLMTLPVMDDGAKGECFAYEQRKEVTGGPWVIDGRETRTIDMNYAYIRPLSALDEWERVN